MVVCKNAAKCSRLVGDSCTRRDREKAISCNLVLPTIALQVRHKRMRSLYSMAAFSRSSLDLSFFVLLSCPCPFPREEENKHLSWVQGMFIALSKVESATLCCQQQIFFWLWFRLTKIRKQDTFWTFSHFFSLGGLLLAKSWWRQKTRYTPV